MGLPPVKHVSCFFCPSKLRRSFEGKEFCFFCSCIILMSVCQFVLTTDRAIAEVNCLSGQSVENNHNNNIKTGDKRPNVVNQSSWQSGLPCNAIWRVFDLSSPTQFESDIDGEFNNVDPSSDRFTHLERLYQTSVDEWLRPGPHTWMSISSSSVLAAGDSFSSSFLHHIAWQASNGQAINRTPMGASCIPSLRCLQAEEEVTGMDYN